MLINYCTQLRVKEPSEPLKEPDIEVLKSIASVPDENFYEHPEALQALIECSRQRMASPSFLFGCISLCISTDIDLSL